MEVQTKLSDEALMASFRYSGDSQYFDLLVSRYQNKLYSMAFNLLGNDCEAEEVVQEAFIRVWRNSHSFRIDATFAGWIFTIMQNLCKDRWRSRQRKQSYEAIFFNPLSVHEHENSVKGYRTAVNILNNNLTEPAQEAELSELRAFLNSCLEQLPNCQREVIILRDLQGHSYKRIASLTGASIGTVRSRLHYGRQKLKNIVK